MSIPVRTEYQSLDPRWRIQVTDDGSRTLIENRCGDAMHSGCGAHAETRHVYLQNSGILDRLAAGEPTRILEVGLGTGLACLMTAQASNEHQTQVEYLAIESQVTPSSIVRQLQFEQCGVHANLINAYCDAIDRASYESDNPFSLGQYTRVQLFVCDAASWRADHVASVHAIYFDPFCPATSPELWTHEMLCRMHSLLVEGGRLTTYCVNRQVRDRMQAAGFAVRRVPGPVGGKREVLIATK